MRQQEMQLPCRILIGPLFNPDMLGNYLGDPDIKVFMSRPVNRSPEAYAVTYDLATDSFDDVLARLPAGWEPDVVIWWDLIYQGLPPGIERCPYPTAVIVGDWNVHVYAALEASKAFDYVFGDRALIQQLQGLGRRNCAYWPGFSFEPNKHYLMPEVEKSYDISFVGNLNHRVQRARSTYLERIARWSGRWRVIISGGVYGADYTRLLNQSRIVFNHSIRGEMNMRAYEAPACGALLFMEAGNLEIRDYLSDGVSCVLYDEQSLESLLETYLGDEGLRARVAAAGQTAIQAHSYEQQFRRLLGHLPDVIRAYQGPDRNILNLAEAEPVLLRQLYRANTPGAEAAAIARLEGLAGSEQPELLNGLAKGLLETAGQERSRLTRAVSLFKRVCELRPESPVAAYNLAVALESLDQPAEAIYRRALACLETASGAAFDRLEPVQPQGYQDRFGIEWELKAGPVLLAWQVYLRLGQLQLRQSLPAAAEASFRAALGQGLDYGETEVYLAWALLAQNQLGPAIEAYERAIAQQAFLIEVWYELGWMLLLTRQYERAEVLLTACLPVLDVNQELARLRPEFEGLLGLVRQRPRQLFVPLEDVTPLDLEDASARNLLLLAERFDASEALAAVAALALELEADPESTLFLWQPLRSLDESELAALEALLADSQASVALIQEDFSPQQQGRLLRAMHEVLGPESGPLGYYRHWHLALERERSEPRMPHRLQALIWEFRAV